MKRLLDSSNNFLAVLNDENEIHFYKKTEEDSNSIMEVDLDNNFFKFRLEPHTSYNWISIILTEPYRVVPFFDYNTVIFYLSKKTKLAYKIHLIDNPENSFKVLNFYLLGLYFYNLGDETIDLKELDLVYHDGPVPDFDKISIQHLEKKKLPYIDKSVMCDFNVDIKDINKIIGMELNVFDNTIVTERRPNVEADILDFSDLEIRDCYDFHYFYVINKVNKIIMPRIDLSTVERFRQPFGNLVRIKVLDMTICYNDLDLNKVLKFDLGLAETECSVVIINKEAKNLKTKILQTLDIIECGVVRSLDIFLAKLILVKTNEFYLVEV